MPSSSQRCTSFAFNFRLQSQLKASQIGIAFYPLSFAEGVNYINPLPFHVHNLAAGLPRALRTIYTRNLRLRMCPVFPAP
jgi:hypothetical protein